MVRNVKNWFVHFLDEKTDTIHACAANTYLVTTVLHQAFKEASMQEATSGNLATQRKSTSLQVIKGVTRNERVTC